MSQPKFNIGDVVQLNSGGPQMSVKEVIKNSIDDNISYSCQWLDKGNPKEAIFTENVLIKFTYDHLMPFSV